MFQYKNSQIIAIIQINLGHNLNDNNEAVLFFDLFFYFFFEADVGVGLFRLVGGRLG